ncbi:bacteriohemerythrin [Haliovirga abyssi]|uniref:Chemotaxis protein CheX n=1 Tax=Haliovirga abyssi TaxID=2996794 RepID=A0AAU9DCX8_9FUSO|nr:bacteriohemerythrin [Haliovirga abyssi]BDU51366.1 hypothetical protein HLVA_19350 [Haliovirga abyssi]
MDWRDSLNLGIEEIDNQHKELVERFNSFLDIVFDKRVPQKERIKKLEDTLNFLGEYVVFHFNSEEAFQKKINYINYEEHKKIHENFTNDVIKFKEKFEKNKEDENLIKTFSGRVAAWLINHIAGEDQKIKNYIDKKEIEKLDVTKTYKEIIGNNLKNIFNMMFQVDIEFAKDKNIDVSNDLIIKVGVIGNLKGDIIYIFEDENAKKLTQTLTGLKVDEVDEFVKSALSEIANIVSGNTITNLSELVSGVDITPPKFVDKIDERIYSKLNVESDLGVMKVLTNIK